jgi:hypothetical protein
VFGVPTIEVDGRLFWGVDALEMLAAFLRGDPWFDGPAWQRAAVAPPRGAAPAPGQVLTVSSACFSHRETKFEGCTGVRQPAFRIASAGGQRRRRYFRASAAEGGAHSPGERFMASSVGTATVAKSTAGMTREEKKVIFASSLGTVFEWYDFYLYGTLAAIIGKQFFTALDPTSQVIFSLLAFAAGFIVRPFGALVFGGSAT